MAVLAPLRAAALTALLAACDPTRAPAPFEYSEDNLAVYAVVEAGADTVRVLLGRFDARATGEESFRRVSGARVRMVRGTDTLRLPDAPPGFSDCSRSEAPLGRQPPIQAGCYAAHVPGGVRSGERYRLRIDLPGGDSVHGVTVVPHPPVLRAPEEGTRVEVPTAIVPGSGVRPGTVRVRWTAPDDVGRIEVALAAAAVYRDGRRLEGATCRLEGLRTPEDYLRADSAVLGVLPPDCLSGSERDRWDSIHARVVVTAYDTAYARYAREVLDTESVRRSHATAGVTGALGIFGAAAPARRSVVLVPAGSP